jgi:hypothetical protein
MKKWPKINCTLLKLQGFQTMHIDWITCMFWLEIKVLNDMGMIWLINLTMMIELIICQIHT